MLCGSQPISNQDCGGTSPHGSYDCKMFFSNNGQETLGGRVEKRMIISRTWKLHGTPGATQQSRRERETAQAWGSAFWAVEGGGRGFCHRWGVGYEENRGAQMVSFRNQPRFLK